MPGPLGVPVWKGDPNLAIGHGGLSNLVKGIAPGGIKTARLQGDGAMGS